MKDGMFEQFFCNSFGSKGSRCFDLSLKKEKLMKLNQIAKTLKKTFAKEPLGQIVHYSRTKYDHSSGQLSLSRVVQSSFIEVLYFIYSEIVHLHHKWSLLRTFFINNLSVIDLLPKDPNSQRYQLLQINSFKSVCAQVLLTQSLRSNK
jgi:hypothetical protein